MRKRINCSDCYWWHKVEGNTGLCLLNYLYTAGDETCGSCEENTVRRKNELDKDQ